MSAISAGRSLATILAATTAAPMPGPGELAPHALWSGQAGAGQAQLHDGAAGRPVDRGRCAAVRTGDCLDDREAEPGPAIRATPPAVWPSEPLERVGQEVGRETGP